MPFCVASVALCDIPTCFMTCQTWFCVAGAILFATFSEDALQFSWQAQHFGDLRCGRHSTFDVSCCVFFPNRIVRAAPSGDTHHSTLYTLHSTLYTPHFTIYTLQSQFHTSHSTLYTPHFQLYTQHSTLSSLHFALRTLHSTLYTLHITLHTSHFTLSTPHFTLYT